MIGVQPADSDAMARSLEAGRRAVLPHVGLFADGVAVKQGGKETFRLARQYVDDVIRVDTDATCAALKDVVGGHIDLLCDQTTVTTPQIKAGTVKVYGVTSKERVSLLRDVPTFHEQGLTDFEILVWFALWAPKGLPKPVFDKLVGGLQAAVGDPAFKAKGNAFGGEPASTDKANPEALRSFFKAEIDKWGPVIRKAGVYAD